MQARYAVSTTPNERAMQACPLGTMHTEYKIQIERALGIYAWKAREIAITVTVGGGKLLHVVLYLYLRFIRTSLVFSMINRIMISTSTHDEHDLSKRVNKWQTSNVTKL